MITFDDAIIHATSLHHGQIDKQGKPYILHPIRVMLALPPKLQIAGLYHDAVEDCDITLEELEKQVQDGMTIEVIDCLTKRKGETREQYIGRACRNPRAIRVKLKDIRDNLDRVFGVDDESRQRLISKYARDLHQIAQAGYDITTGELLY